MPDLSLDLRYLRCAFSAAELGSFRRAAKVLELPQSTVSRRIQLLERRLGFPLFNRNWFGAKLTPAGEEFLKDAKVSAHQLNRAAQLAVAVHRGGRGHLNIAILASLSGGFLHNVLRRFRRQYPDIHVTVREGTPHEVLRGLAVGDLDISFVTGEPNMPGYESKRLWTESIFVVLPATHPLAHKQEVDWTEIREETFIVTRGGPGAEIHDYLIRKLARPGFHPRIDIHDVSRASLLDLVGMEYGITLTSTSSYQPGIEHLAYRVMVGEKDSLPSSAVWSASNNNPGLKKLLELAERAAQEGIRSAVNVTLGLALVVMLACRHGRLASLFEHAQTLDQFL